MSVSTVLHALPDGDGGIFGVMSVTSRNTEERERFLHILKSHLEEMRFDIVTDDVNIPRRFEAMLVRLNADLARFSTTHRLPLKHINIIIGVMTNTQVFFSGIGTHHALFLHQTAERRYVVYELDAQLANQESTWEKPLVTVLDGELHPGDVFYVATRIPAHALNLGDVQDILVTLPPNGALERIQQFVPVTQHYGGVCFHVNDDVAVGPPKKTNPMASLSSFEETQARTADLLGDQAPDVSQKIAHVLQSTKKALTAYSESAVWRGIKRGARGIITFVEQRIQRHMGGKDFSPQRSRVSYGRFQGIATKITSLRHAGITAAQGASRTTKIVGIGAALVIGILIMSVSMSRAQQRSASANAAYEAQIMKIEEKRTAAEAAIIYGNTQSAQTLLADAQALIATLPRDTNTQKTKAEDLARATSELLGQTRGLETITATVIAELPEQFSFPLIGLTNAGTAMYGVAADATPWRVNEISKTLERVDFGASPAQNVSRVAQEGADILVVDMDNRLWRATTGTPSITSLTSGTNAMASVEDIVTYNSTMYALSTTTSQIVKMRPQGLGFEAGTPWISGKTSDISQAKALAIDGDIWVLTQTDVVVFSSGKERPWNHAAIDPALVKPIDLWTSVDSKYLYILDGADGRVLVFDKTSGGIVAQYITNITSTVGFAIRESENRILLATPTSVYSFTATHLLK